MNTARGSLILRFGTSAGGEGASHQTIAPQNIAAAVGMRVEDLKDVVVEDVVVEQTYSSCALPIGFSVNGPLASICNFIVDFEVKPESFCAMSVLWPQNTNSAPYRLMGERREKSSFTKQELQQGILNVHGDTVMLAPRGPLSKEIAAQRGEGDAAVASKDETERTLAKLLHSSRRFDLSAGIPFETRVLGRKSGLDAATENAYLVLGISLRAVSSPSVAESQDEEFSELLDELTVQDSDAKDSVQAPEAPQRSLLTQSLHMTRPSPSGSESEAANGHGTGSETDSPIPGARTQPPTLI